MLLPAGVAMNDLLALAEEMDPGGSPEEGKKGRRDKRMLTANSTMQLAAYLAGKVSPGIIFDSIQFDSMCLMSWGGNWDPTDKRVTSVKL